MRMNRRCSRPGRPAARARRVRAAAPPAACGFISFSASQGVTVKAMASDIAMPRLLLIGIGLMYGPISPLTKAIGSSAAITVSVARMVGPPTSSTAAGMISRSGLPGSSCLVAVDVLDHHDGVVDQDADGEDQREQAHAVEREAPGPAGEQRGREREDDGRADDDGLAPAQRQAHQQDHRAGGEGQLLDQLVGLFGGGLAVVARHGGLDAGGASRVLRSSSTRSRAARATSTAFSPGFLVTVSVTAGWPPAAAGAAPPPAPAACGAGREPDIARGLRGAGLHLRHLAQVHRLALVHADHQLAHVGAAQELAGLHASMRPLPARRPRCRRACPSWRGQRLLQAQQVHAALAQPAGVSVHLHHAARAADGLHLARAGHALELGLHRVRHALQLERAGGVVAAPQRDGQHRHVVDALGLDDGRQRPRPRGSQSWLALSTSYRRTSASVRGTPTWNCTVSTAMPGRETE
jgi:hypothetical protein